MHRPCTVLVVRCAPQELAALFSVVGTPGWAAIDSVVLHPSWHAYLRHLPGR